MVQTSNVPRLVGTRFGAVAAKMWCAVLQRQAGCLQAVSFESLEMFYFGKQTYGGFLKWDYSEIIHFHEVFHYKASILSPPIYGTPRAELLGTRKWGALLFQFSGEFSKHSLVADSINGHWHWQVSAGMDWQGAKTPRIVSGRDGTISHISGPFCDPQNVNTEVPTGGHGVGMST